MENQNATNQVVLTPVELISIVQQKLGKVPFDIEHDNTIGQPIRESVILLERLKQVISAPPTPSETKAPVAKKKPSTPKEKPQLQAVK